MRSSSEIKSDARLIMQQNLRSILLISLGYLAVTYILSLLYSELSGFSEYMKQYSEMVRKYMETGEMYYIEFPQVKTTSNILATLISLASIVLAGGYRGYHLLRARGMEANFMDIMPNGGQIFRILCIDFASGLIIALGLMLFIVPGVILAYSYSQAIFVMYDNPGMSAFQCMRESRRLMRGHKLRLFRLEISFLGWVIVAAIVGMFLPILNIWLDPYMGISVASFYNELIARENSAPMVL